jgi:N-acetylmuramoyl-L-alanine amidase
VPQRSPHCPIISTTLTALLTAASICHADAVAASDSSVEQHCLALTMYWEARGEGTTGMTAVGWTVLNRVQSEDFPNTPCEVIHQGGERPPCEFSWWCDGKSDRPRDRRSWQAALTVASQLLSNPPQDPTQGALYFRNAGAKPAWKAAPTVRIGRHVFYR